MSPRSYLTRFLVPVTAAILCLASSPGAAQQGTQNAAKPATQQMPLRLTALAVRTVEPSASAPIDITIERWTSDADAENLINAITEGGPKKLLDAMRRLKPVGRIAGSGSVGFEVRYARLEQTSQGRQHITLATDRVMSFWEASNTPRSSDYPYTFVEIQLDSAGQGSGTVAVAAKIVMDRVNKTLVLENYETQPVKLQAVKRQGR
ncbi:MAG: hypothetical protein ABIW19_08345 [Vicinamibacterales bacterium]